MANERLYQFPGKVSPVPADIIYAGDSANAFAEVQITIQQLISAYPNLFGFANLTLGANTFPYSNNSSVLVAGSITSFGVAFLALSSTNNSTLVTSSGGVPSLSQTLPALVQGNITQLGTQSQALNMGSNLINNVATPLTGTDAANKAYADSIAGGLIPVPGVQAASTVNLNATYSNGSSGVGATLTNAGTQAAFAVDGYTAVLNDRILVKNQTTAADNGIYTVTTLGSNSTNWVLTRATNYDTTAQIQVGDLVSVAMGGQALSSWYQTNTISTIGTDPISFSVFFNPANFANSGANSNITSMTGLTGYISSPLGVKGSYGNIVVAYFDNGASYTNYVGLGNNVTGNAPAVQAFGSDTNISLDVKGKGNLGAMIHGVGTNVAASSGYVGELISSTVLVGSAVSMSSGIAKDITSISLTAGDWDVWGSVWTSPAGSTTTQGAVGWIATISATLPTPPNEGAMTLSSVSSVAGAANGYPIGQKRILLSGTTTVYLSAIFTFSVSTLGAYGIINARRRS